MGSSHYIVAVDVGTTNIRCYVYNQKAEIKGEAKAKVELKYSQRGWVELDPDDLWDSFVQVVKNGINSAGINAYQVSCLGISTQRGTFVTWDKETGRPFHNFITWNDLRADSLCKGWNNSMQMKCMRLGSRILHFFSRSKRFLAASLLKLSTPMAVMRLVWVLQNIPEVQHRASEGQALFGTVDTWLVWKLTGGRVHATDSSCACITGLFDPFQMRWAGWAINMFSIPPSLLPVVKSTSGEFGKTVPNIFGASIPITSVVGDQQASMFGECCFEVGDVKCTMGTGSFININTGSYPHTSYKGLYPLVGWTINDEVTYVAEGCTLDTGTTILWAQNLGLFVEPSETSNMAKSVTDNGGVYFIPAFSGLQAPINDSQAAAAFIGVNAKTTPAHFVRAILEALSFRVKQMFDIMIEEADFEMNHFRMNGGVANNDFLVQLICDLIGHPVDRSAHRDMSSLGAAYLAGLAAGVWKDKKELVNLRKNERTFIPNKLHHKEYFDIVVQWERAVNRCLHWYIEKS